MIVEVYQKEVFNKIIDYIRAQKLDELVVARDFNQDLASKEIREFYSELEIRDAYQIFNYIEVIQLDNIHQTRSKAIDLIAISNNLIA